MAGAAGVFPGQPQQAPSTILKEIEFVHVTKQGEDVSHKSVIVDDSFYFNPTTKPDDTEVKPVDYLAFSVGRDKYFVTEQKDEQSLQETFAITIKGEQKTIGVYPFPDVLPQDEYANRANVPANKDDLYNNIGARIDWLDNTSTRGQAQADLPALRKQFAEQALDEWCKGGPSEYIGQDLNDFKKYVCPPTEANK